MLDKVCTGTQIMICESNWIAIGQIVRTKGEIECRVPFFAQVRSVQFTGLLNLWPQRRTQTKTITRKINTQIIGRVIAHVSFPARVTGPSSFGALSYLPSGMPPRSPGRDIHIISQRRQLRCQRWSVRFIPVHSPGFMHHQTIDYFRTACGTLSMGTVCLATAILGRVRLRQDDIPISVI